MALGASVLPALLALALVVAGEEDSICLFGLKREEGQAEPAGPVSADAGYPWSRRGGNGAGNSYTSAVGPDLTQGPSWVWKNELDEQVRHSPLIDNDLNVYLQSSYHIRKFSADGEELWTWRVPRKQGILVVAPALYDGKVYAVSTLFLDKFDHAVVHALDMQTGEVLLTKSLSDSYTFHRDSPGLFIEEGKMVLPVHDTPVHHHSSDTAPNALLAVNITSMEELWVFPTESILWNFMPSSVGDGTIIFASTCGKVMRVRLQDGSEVWRGGNLTAAKDLWCSTGGGVLGGDGNFYTEYNRVDPGSSLASARVAAFRVSDGQKLWEKSLGKFDVSKANGEQDRRMLMDYGGWQYPSVGLLGGQNKRRAVVVAIGGLTTSPPVMDWPASWSGSRRSWLWQLYLTSSNYRKNTMSAPDIPNAIVALDTKTGGALWRYEFPTWDHFGSIDDETSILARVDAAVENPVQQEVLCLAGSQGIPVISGDGTVYASDGHRGTLYAIKDSNEDGLITDDEVIAFETEKEFHNSPSVASGMLAVAPCWGDMYVFRSP